MADIGPGLPQKLEGAQRQKYVLDYLIDLKLAAKKADADKLTRARVRQEARLLSRQAGDGGAARLRRQGRDDRGSERKAYDEAAKAEPPQEEIHARHILLPSEDEAKKALARVKGGEDFAKVANELSKDPAGDGGDLGWFTKDRMVPEFSDAAFKLKKGEISDPVKTQFGWHIIKIEDTRKKSFPPFEQLRTRRPLRRPEGGKRGGRSAPLGGEDPAFRRRRQAGGGERKPGRSGSPAPAGAVRRTPTSRRTEHFFLKRKRRRGGAPSARSPLQHEDTLPWPLPPRFLRSRRKPIPPLPPIAGVRFATAAAGVRYADARTS